MAVLSQVSLHADLNHSPNMLCIVLNISTQYPLMCFLPQVETADEKAARAEETLLASRWIGFGEAMQKWWPLVLVLLLAIALPIGLAALSRFGFSCGLLSLMPRDAGQSPR